MAETCQEMMAPELQRLLNSAVVAIDKGRLKSAAQLYGQVLKYALDDPNLHHTLGLVYFEAGRSDKALFHIGRSIELDSSNAVAFRSFGDALAATKQYAMALRAYRKSQTLDETAPDTLLNTANVYYQLGMFGQMQKLLEDIIDQHPGHVKALNNLAKLLHDTGQWERALSVYNRCVGLESGYAEARFNRSLLLLSMGDYQQGWKEYQWRFSCSDARNIYPHSLDGPRWHGEAYPGRRLLVHCEQGLGDVLQFIRYLPMVKRLGGTLILEVQKPLASLLNNQAFVDEVIVFNSKTPPSQEYDLYVPLMDLPLIFETDVKSIPTKTPYIDLDYESSHFSACHLKRDCLNIGLIWESSNLNPLRNLPIDQCESWFQHPEIHYVSLQIGNVSGHLRAFNHMASSITQAGPLLKDFRDTAAVMTGLDLVISVDTAAAHLAGALGKPLWALVPFNADWRWITNEDKCLWYPEARLFRQKQRGDWKQTIEEVAAALQRFTHIKG